jgi:hypothetical protein
VWERVGRRRFGKKYQVIFSTIKINRRKYLSKF